jgi:aminopeptidase N
VKRKFSFFIQSLLTSREMKMRLSKALGHNIVIFLFIIASFVSCQNPVNYRLSGNVAPSIYDLHITVDLANLKFSGSETIYMHANQPTSTIELHALDLSIDDVRVIEGENEITINRMEYNNETQIFAVHLGQSLVSGRDYELRMAFEGEIMDDMKGLYRSSYYENRVIK